VRIEPIAAGELLLKKNGKGTHFEHILKVSQRAVAVEQEGFGVLLVAHVNNVSTLVIHGISDLLDNKTEVYDGFVPEYDEKQMKETRHIITA
jgi:nucleoside phosphorylase